MSAYPICPAAPVTATRMGEVMDLYPLFARN
jgi:hypothetical protein